MDTGLELFGDVLGVAVLGKGDRNAVVDNDSRSDTVRLFRIQRRIDDSPGDPLSYPFRIFVDTGFNVQCCYAGVGVRP